jgi:A/G-specific adenine glycosylase
VIHGAGEHEQQIGQPVDVTDQDRIDWRVQRHDPPLGAAADGASDMQRGARGRAAGEDEPTQRRQRGLQTIDQLLEHYDLRVGDNGFLYPWRELLAGIGELGAEREQVPLDCHDFDVDGRIDSRRGQDEPEPGVELVDFPVRVDAGIVLARACAVEERRLARIAGSRVDFHQRIMASKRAVALPIPLSPDRRRFRQRLLTWYRRHGRDLPWRKTDDPYHILVSEIMLQQTQVDRVLPKYAEWLDKYPSMDVLAAAPEDEVSETWRPLGYNIRPRRLQSIARESVAKYGGQLPSDEATLLSFKGIGQYTAGAIRSFAFRERAAILDTNVARVLFRMFVGSGDPKSHAMKRHLWALSYCLVPVRHVFDFNQALMDLGAMVCVARSPKCLVCPMQKDCAWRRRSS